jgi:DNA-binding LacI/PurR family transcriptional regulator
MTIPKKKISIIDVAREAGVSPSTVSRVIHEKPFVAESVRKKVKQALAQMDYRPNYAARFLPKGRTGYIAVATPRGSHDLFANPYSTRVLDGIGQVLDQTTYQLILATTPVQFHQLVRAHTVDGILLLGVEMNDAYLEDLEQSGLPVIVIGGYSQKTRFSVFTPDYARAVRLGVEHLNSLGHKRVGFICGPPNRYKWRTNQLEFESALRDFGMDEVGSIVTADYAEETSYRIISEMIHSGARLPSGYVSTSDILAIGLMKGAQDNGIEVPEDLSVVGYGDIARAALSRPPLTTVGGRFTEMAAEACRTLISMIESGVEEEPFNRVIEVELVVRGSTCRPRS